MASKHSAKFGEMARRSAERTGSKRFVHLPQHDDRQPWPQHRARGNDSPFKNFRGTTRWNWMIHDFRTFGFKEFVRKHWYLGDFWRQKGEKIFAGQDECGNKFWYTNDTTRGDGGRMVEPADPHWFRGQDANIAPPVWQMWLTRMVSHTPAQIKARGEWGPHGRLNGNFTVFNIKWQKDAWLGMSGNDPTYVPTTSMLLSPWYKLIKEAGFSRYNPNRGMPVYMPMMQPHDIKQEVVEEFWRGQTAFCRWSKGHDHDEWRN